jgi:hypothetical protein
VKNSLDTDYISFLTRLRAGDLVTYGGIEWQVDDFSTYDDAKGYEMMEWVIRSHNSSNYLLREVDPENPETNINWYLSEEIGVNRISGEHVGDNMQFGLWDAMHNRQEPYPKLRAMGRLYYFESKTEGTYKSEGDRESRTTWDYWDEEHQWNLAIEAWQDRELHVYSTQKVSPEEFTIAEKLIQSDLIQSDNFLSANSANPNIRKKSQTSDRTWQWVCAWGLVIAGFILMMSGDW